MSRSSRLPVPSRKSLALHLIAGVALGLAWATPVVALAQARAQNQGSSQGQPEKVGAGIESLRSSELKDPTNAALRHYRAWSLTDTSKLKEFDELWSKESDLKAGWEPSVALTRLVSELNEYAGNVILASKLENADWGVEYSDGFMALLPHLGLVRRETRFLEGRARILLQSGKPEDHTTAIESLAASFRISHHVVNDRTLISTLVSGSIADRAATTTLALLDEGKITKADAPVLLAAAKSIPASDPFNVIGALHGELWLAASAFAKTGADAGKQAVDVAKQLLDLQNDAARGEQVMAKIGAMTEADLRADVLKHKAYFDEAERLYRADEPDVTTKLKALTERLDKGEFGVTLQLTAPSIMKAAEADRKHRVQLRAVITRLESLR